MKKDIKNAAPTEKNRKTREFSKLQKDWYKKLKKEGFKDIESGIPETPYLADHHIKTTEKMVRAYRDLAVEWHAIASGYYWVAEFDRPLDKYIWKKHLEGLTLKQIEKALKRTNLPHVSYNTVSLAIMKINKQMLASDYYKNYYYDPDLTDPSDYLDLKTEIENYMWGGIRYDREKPYRKKDFEE